VKRAGRFARSGSRICQRKKQDKKRLTMMKQTLIHAMMIAAFAASAFHGNAQQLTGAPADPQIKYSMSTPPRVASPDKVETRLGTLNFFDGFPGYQAVRTAY